LFVEIHAATGGCRVFIGGGVEDTEEALDEGYLLGSDGVKDEKFFAEKVDGAEEAFTGAVVGLELL
jgi:hypothetical protein